MYLPSALISTKDDVILLFECPMCSSSHELHLTLEQYNKVYEYYNGVGYAQDTGLDVVSREKLISGYCEKCQENAFAIPEEDEEE